MNPLRYSIRIAIPGRTLVAADDITITPGKLTMLFGESGIGKSLVMRAIFGLLDPSEFDITINGIPYADYRESSDAARIRGTGYFVFQEPSTHLNPLRTLREQVNEGSIADSRGEAEALLHLWKDNDPHETAQVLDVYPTPHRPSGGEKARVLSLGAFKKIEQWLSAPEGTQPPVFIFDEPTGNLDNATRDHFLSFLLQQHLQRPFTGIIITHDYSIITYLRREFPLAESAVEYQEMKSELGMVALHRFDTGAYRRWLTTTAHLPREHAATGETLLHVDATMRVHGRLLETGKTPSCVPGADLEVRAGSLVYLKAPSGEGKTTFVKALMGLVRPETMRMSCCGKMYTEETPRSTFHRKMWGKTMTMVFQHADEALNARATVRHVFDGLPTVRTLNDERVRTAMEMLFSPGEIEPLLKKRIGTLSGGQKQRVNLLRSLVLDTPLLILDEPLSGLDFDTLRKVLGALKAKREAGTGILLISHNEEIFDALVSPEEVYYVRARLDSVS